eukprot:SAG25_NODE_10559_length_329_cov_1.117391_1_plen_54_part_10
MRVRARPRAASRLHPTHPILSGKRAMGSFPFTFLTGQQGGNLCLFTATVPCRQA